MNKLFRSPLFTIAFILFAVVFTAQATPLTEAQKIDKLIAYVAGLENAVFIRNGSEFPAKQAAEHLQLKRKKAGSNVKTADDFIRLLATKSSMSGEAYKVRFMDGRIVTSEQLLRQELARLNAIK